MSTVLLVEDDPALVMVIEAALADRGLQVLTAGGDKAAQRILERDAAHIGVLIAVVHLGSAATGFDVSRRARRLNPRQAEQNLAVIEQIQRLLHTNVQEALALEVGLLKLNL